MLEEGENGDRKFRNKRWEALGVGKKGSIDDVCVMRDA